MHFDVPVYNTSRSCLCQRTRNAEEKITLATLHDQEWALFAKVDALTDAIRDGFQDVNAQLKDLHTRVDILHGLMENLLVRVEQLEQEYTMITAGLKRLEVRFDQLEATRLKERIDVLEKRVTALESVQN